MIVFLPIAATRTAIERENNSSVTILGSDKPRRFNDMVNCYPQPINFVQINKCIRADILVAVFIFMCTSTRLYAWYTKVHHLIVYTKWFLGKSITINDQKTITTVNVKLWVCIYHYGQTLYNANLYEIHCLFFT